MSMFTQFPAFRLASIAVATAVSLGGCYQVDTPIITSGDYAPVAGDYFCANQITGQKANASIVEKKSGFLWPSYSYDGGDGVEIMLSDLGNSLFLMQSTQNGKINIEFLEVEDSGISILIANTMSFGPQIDALASKNHVSPHLLQNGLVSLSGDPADITAFLSSHSKGMMAVAISCSKK
ncbi:hypothetical protein [Oryzibacter oryziterrae]|uniref:hypothetical protein n=1 Tax=Oryzibacter oryziterrae TaxID=2766474 RepID=UPI001F169C3E|nr:hypothetical protein [Oryzibacter oryziterrae]